MFANARTRPAVDFDADPNNPSAGMVQETLMRLHGFLVPAVLGGDSDPERQFHGYGPQLQDFRGAASPASTGAIPNGGNAELSSAVVAGPMGDPARRIFADRLRRRGAM